jgi:putative transposase
MAAMVWYFVHLVVSLLWDGLRFSRLSPDDKTLELLLLRQQVLILRRHQKRGPTLMRREKFILLTLVEHLRHAANLQKVHLEHLVLIFQPETLLRWHRELVRRKWTFVNTPKAPGRPSTDPRLVQVILRLANENRWGDDRITGELKKLGYRVSHETVRKILRRHGVLPISAQRVSSNWRTFLHHYKATFLACDFFTIETIRLQTLSVFFFIEIGTRRVHVAGITPQPTQHWVAQQARQFLWNLETEARLFTHLVRDNDGKYSASFDAVFESAGIEVVSTPFRAPRANAYAERWVRSVREECLNQVIILDQRHLAYVLREYAHFFNTARPHQGIDQQVPCPPVARLTSGNIARRDSLGGILHDYDRAA